MINPRLIFFQATTFPGPSCFSVSNLSSGHISHIPFPRSECWLCCGPGVGRTAGRAPCSQRCRTHPNWVPWGFWASWTCCNTSLCSEPAFPAKKSHSASGCEFTAQGLASDAQPCLWNVPFPFFTCETQPAEGRGLWYRSYSCCMAQGLSWCCTVGTAGASPSPSPSPLWGFLGGVTVILPKSLRVEIPVCLPFVPLVKFF